MSKSEIRWYKGKWKVRIIKRSEVKGKHRPRNMLVEALEYIDYGMHTEMESESRCQRWSVIKEIKKGERFTTVPRLLWRKPRK